MEAPEDNVLTLLLIVKDRGALVIHSLLALISDTEDEVAVVISSIITGQHIGVSLTLYLHRDQELQRGSTILLNRVACRLRPLLSHAPDVCPEYLQRDIVVVIKAIELIALLIGLPILKWVDLGGLVIFMLVIIVYPSEGGIKVFLVIAGCVIDPPLYRDKQTGLAQGDGIGIGLREEVACDKIGLDLSDLILIGQLLIVERELPLQ